MDEKTIDEMRKALDIPEGGELLKARLDTEPDGSVHQVLLIDYGPAGVKKFRATAEEVRAAAAAKPEIYTAEDAEKEESAEETPPAKAEDLTAEDAEKEESAEEAPPAKAEDLTAEDAEKEESAEEAPPVEKPKKPASRRK